MKINALAPTLPTHQSAPAPKPAAAALPSATTPAGLNRLPGQLPSDPAAARQLVALQAAGAGQALAGPKKFDRNSSPEDLLKLAQEAATLAKGDPRLAALLDQLKTAMDLPIYASDSEIKRRHDALGRAYMLVADKLRPEDLDALVGGLKGQFMLRRYNVARRNDAPFAAVLGKAAESMSPQDSARVRAALRLQLTQPDAGGAAQALGCMASTLRKEDVHALEDYLDDMRKRNNGFDHDNGHQRAAYEAMTRTLELARDKEAQHEAAWVLVDDLRGDRLNDAQKDRLIEAAQEDAELKRAALDSLPDSRLDGGLLEQVNRSFAQSLSLKIRYAPEGSPWKKLGKLMAARAMAEKPEFRGKVNVDEIERQINQMCGQEPFKSEFEQTRSISNHSLRESVVPSQIAYLKSADFQRRLKLLSPEEGKKLVDLELHQLAALAPDQVQAVADELAGRSIQDQAARAFRNTEPAIQKKAVEVAMQQVPGYESHLADCAEPLATVAAKIPPGLTPEQTDQVMISELTALAVAAQAAQKLDLYGKIMSAKEFYGKLAANGRGPAFLNAIKLGAMVMKGVPDDPRQWTEAAGTVMKAGGQAHEVAQLFRVSSTGKAMSALKCIRWAGPLGETIGVVLSVRDMAADFKQGDYVGASFKGLQAVAGGAGVLAGIYIAAGCTGPFWPAVAIGGTLAYWALAGLDEAYGDSDEVSFLKNLGVYQG